MRGPLDGGPGRASLGRVATPKRLFGTLLAAAAISLATGCDEGKGSYGAPMGPPVHVIATSLDRYRNGSDEARDVPLHPLFVVRFDRMLATSSDFRPNFSIRSGVFTSVTYREIRVDPVEREVVFAIADDLLPQTRYSLHVESSAGPGAVLAAIDGAPFAGPFDLPFTTESARAPGEVAETDVDPGASPDDPCNAKTILTATCAGTNCHGKLPEALPDGGLTSATAPVLGLDLATGAGIQSTAIDHAAVEVAYEATPSGAGEPVTPAFPFGLPLIRPGQSAASYLIYKILKRGPVGDATPPAPFDLADVADPSGRAVADLRSVPGSGMPHDALPSEPGAGSPPPPLRWSDVRLLRRWIDRGARPCER